ncbi:MAG TPA: hypothetical protein VFG64_07195 [Dongiaceae bacterium]|nr:hypothetical protein [Dongiaceae bacterium]
MTIHRPVGRRIALALGFGCVLALAGCDKGPDTAQTAAELKSGVEAQLARLEGPAAQKVISHAAVNVTAQQDGAYLVSIEGLKVQPAPEGYLDIGTISYLAKPKDETSYEVSGLKMPETMPFKGPDGKERGKLTVTTKAFSGLWLKELGAFQKLDAEFSDIAATDDSAGDMRVADAKVTSELTDKGGGVFDAVGNLVLSGFTAKDTGGGVFAIAESRLDGKYDSMKLADYQAALAKYQELALKQVGLAEQGTGNPAQPPALSPDEQKAMSEAISTMAGSIKGGDFKIALTGLKYTENGQDPFTLGALTLGTNIDGINQDKASLGFDIAHQDLAVATEATASPVAQATLPKSGNLSLKVTGVPSKDIVKVLADNLPGMTSSDMSMAEANATAMLVALQAVFQASGARIEVAPSQLVAQLTDLKADGSFDVSPQAAFGIVGGVNIAIRGMDDLLALAQKTPDDIDAQQAISSVGMLQQYSAREQGADGKPVDKFKIEVNEQGQFLVNGKPM